MSKTRNYWNRSPVQRPHSSKKGNRGYVREKLGDEEIIEHLIDESTEYINFLPVFTENSMRKAENSS